MKKLYTFLARRNFEKLHELYFSKLSLSSAKIIRGWIVLFTLLLSSQLLINAKAMTRDDLINKIIKEKKIPDVTKKHVTDIIDAAFDEIQKSIKKEGSFSFPGFGTFIKIKRKDIYGRTIADVKFVPGFKYNKAQTDPIPGEALGIKIYLGNLPLDITEDELQRIFVRYGEIDSVKIITDPLTGLSIGLAIIKMPDCAEAEIAIEALTGSYIEDKPLIIIEVIKNKK